MYGGSGRFSGRKKKDLKINPVYSDVNNVNHFSDINGNMSPVHVVTYESFPRSRKNTVPSENGNKQNGEAIKTINVDLESDNNNVNDKPVEINKSDVNKTRNDINQVTNGEVKNPKINEGNDNLKILNSLKGNSIDKASTEFVNGQSDQQTDTKVINSATDTVQGIQTTTDQEVQTRAYFKDYGLLGYTNGSFVLDETHIIIETKESEAENPKQVSSNEIHTNASEQISQSEANGVPPENSSVISVTSKYVSEDQTKVISSTQNSQTESVNASDLPESTYQEISDLCDLHTPISEGLCSPTDLPVSAGDDLPNPCESPQICHTEIVTEVLVHNSAINETPKMHYRRKYSENDKMCHSFDNEINPYSMLSQKDDNSDWPDIDELARKPDDVNVDDDNVDSSKDEIAQNEGSKIESPGHVRSISDAILQENVGNEGSDNKPPCEEQNSETSSVYKKKRKKSNSCSKSCVVSEVGSSTRTLKSILSNGSSHYSCPSDSEHKRQNSDLEIHELKSVKFSEDTVFNENKSNKYKKEKFGNINLRELYRGKIMSDNAVAKMNPLYQPEDNIVEDGDDPDNGKLTYQLTLKNALRLSKAQVNKSVYYIPTINIFFAKKYTYYKRVVYIVISSKKWDLLSWRSYQTCTHLIRTDQANLASWS